MLKVVGTTPSWPAVVESDEYIPFSADVSDEPAAGPLYARISGVSGGELELKVDRHTGALVGFVVIDLPPPGAGAAVVTGANATIEEGAAPLFDRAPWEPNPDLQPTRDIVDLRVPLRLVPTATGTLVPLLPDAGELAGWIRWGSVGFGIAPDNRLAAIELPIRSR